MSRKKGSVTTSWDEEIGLEGLGLDVESFGIDPGSLRDLSKRARILARKKEQMESEVHDQ